MEFSLHEIFTLNVHPFEIILRGTIIYISLLILLRAFKRSSGDMSMTDLLLIVLLADASQNAMAGEYQSISEGIILILTLIFWDYLLDLFSYKFKLVNRIIHPHPKCLIENGKLNRKNMFREFISEEEIIEQLHQNGIEDISEVKEAYLESNGKFSVIKKE